MSEKGQSFHETGLDILPSSFRDPSGFLFEYDGVLYRQINYGYRDHYDCLMDSGLYKQLSELGMLVQHKEVKEICPDRKPAYKVICPKRIDFISYPYEWSFNQLKDAGLLTLDIQLKALHHHMSLKDASAYNIQFDEGRPIMIDTLSFEKYTEGQAWVAYRQFCQHFLAPLALMARTDVRLSKLLFGHIDGIPLDLGSGLLPRSTWLRPGLAIHLHLHARAQMAYRETSVSRRDKKKQGRHVSKRGLVAMTQGLRKTVSNLKWQASGTEWGNYYAETNYSDVGFQEKRRLVAEYLEKARPAKVWDFGANTGVFSRLASGLKIPTVSFDIDPAAVDMNYLQVREDKEKLLLPLVLDLTNPSPALGWDSRERESLMQRGPAGCIMALALIHHLGISNNVPFDRMASFFSKLCKFLIIEFIPKEDSQVKRLLRSRLDIFGAYDRRNFEAEFSRYFQIVHTEGIRDSSRRLYLMRNLRQ